jgi:hypothetical protein
MDEVDFVLWNVIVDISHCHRSSSKSNALAVRSNEEWVVDVCQAKHIEDGVRV